MTENGHRRMVSVNWAGLGDQDEDDRFFESYDRMSSVVAVDLASSGSSSDEDDRFDDPRMSFVSAISSTGEDFRCLSGIGASTSSPTASSASHEDYNVWMAEPGSINERRKRLFHGMGFGFSNKELLRLASMELQRAVSKEVGGNCQVSPLIIERAPGGNAQKQEPSSTSPLPGAILVRSRSDGDIDFPSVAKRKEEFFGAAPKQHLTRTSTTISAPCKRVCRYPDSMRASPEKGTATSSCHRAGLSPVFSNNRFGAIFLIKNLDTGKEFIVNEYDNEGMWNRLSDLQTGKQLTMEEFEKSVGYSPVVKELMRRENARLANSGGIGGSERKLNPNSYFSKSLRLSKRSGVALLKNIKGVASSVSGLIGDVRERESQPGSDQKPCKSPSPTPSSEWVRVRQHGKSYKELSALQLCQEIQAHEGSIWAIRFSLDAHYLASAGEDRVIHVWEVQESELMSIRPDEWSLTPLHPLACSSPDRYEGSCLGPPGSLLPSPSEKKKKGKGSQSGKKGIPDYVYAPETVFGLSEKPVCSFRGHLDDVLDLSWSRSQVSFSLSANGSITCKTKLGTRIIVKRYRTIVNVSVDLQLLLSSSMDKTVRLWDVDTKSCLKLFAHNDYGIMSFHSLHF